MRRKLHGDVHPALAEALDNLAWSLMGLNGPPGRAAVPGSARDEAQMLGDTHPELAAGLNNLAYVFETRAEYRGAEQAVSRIAGDEPQAARPSHPKIALVMSNLAFVLDEKGDRPAAIRLQRQSLEMSRRELGSDHPDVAGGAASLGLLADLDGRVRRSRAPDRREPRDPSQGARSGASAGREQPDGARQPARCREALRRSTRCSAGRTAQSRGSRSRRYWRSPWRAMSRALALTGLGQYATAGRFVAGAEPARLSTSPFPNLPAVAAARCLRGRSPLRRKYRDVSP